MMASTRLRSALAVLVLVALPLAATWAKPADSHDADTAAIKKLFSDFNDAFNNHDAHAVSMFFTDDAYSITTLGGATKGKAGMEEHLAPLFAGRSKNEVREVTLRDIRFLRPDTATVTGDYVMSGITGRNGEAVPPNKGVYDWIVLKDNGRWLIAAWHESNVPAPAGPPPGR